jgi:hypothetical protein
MVVMVLLGGRGGEGCGGDGGVGRERRPKGKGGWAKEHLHNHTNETY